ncbi:MAG: serine/threonine protein kinase [Planctomycetes bacterium]|nr:serine/threonine protein kinase [Planctomycetota bacterium]
MAPAPIGLPSLNEPGLHQRLAAVGHPIPGPDQSRFELQAMLGSGASGAVYSVLDRNLDRELAVKVLETGSSSDAEEIRRFIGEARITAALEHPNVLPVHEIDVGARGEVFFTMKKIRGSSLGEAIMSSTHERHAERIASFNATVGIFQAVGNALAFAHHAGIVHQDIKPDNIMLGGFGEILLVDWGSAVRIDSGTVHLYGTPLYMSPEQARNECVDRLSDIYCLGATLFHTLALRCPTWSDDADEFWRMKRAGEINALTAEERRSVPPPLIAIARKAMAPRPQDRYQSAEAFIADLDQYQAGLAVSVHRDALLVRLGRWHRRHGRALWTVLSALAIIASLLGALYGERLKELASWGRPILDQRFVDDSWTTRWQVTGESFAVRDGLLVSTRESCMARFRDKLIGDTAIEYDAQILDGAQPGDLSMIWSRDLALDGGPAADIDPSSYFVQIGARGGVFSDILIPIGYGGTEVAHSTFRPQIGRMHHVRVEFVHTTITVWVDHQRIMGYEDILPFSQGYLTLYAYFSGKAFSNVRIYSRGMPAKLPATALGDYCVQQRRYREAEEIYIRVARAHPGSGMANEAIYKAGLSDLLDHDPAGAFARWEPLRSTPWEPRVDLHRLDQAFAAGDHDRVLTGLASLYTAGSEAIRNQVAVQWSDYARKLTDATREDVRNREIEPYLDLHDRLFPHEHVTDRTTAAALNIAERYQQVVDRFPEDASNCVDALIRLGRIEEAAERWKNDSTVIGQETLFAMPGYDPLEGRYPNPISDPLHALIMIDRGRTADLPARFDANPAVMYDRGQLDALAVCGDHQWETTALISLGRLDEIPPQDARRVDVLLARGRYQEAYDVYGHHYFYLMWPRLMLGLQAFIAGDHAAALKWFETPPACELRQAGYGTTALVIVPFLRELAGDAGAMERTCARVRSGMRYAWRQRPWHNAMFLSGAMDEEAYRRQLYVTELDADLLLCRAVAHERAQEPAAALGDYRAWQELPVHRRASDPVVRTFISWRIEVLGGVR